MQKQDSPKEFDKEILWKHLQQTKKILLQSTKQQSKFEQNLVLIHSLLSHLNLSDVPKLQTLFYDILKPISRQITNFNVKQNSTLKAMKQVILKIVELYCNVFIKYENINSFQITKQLICRDSLLFAKKLHKNDAAAAVPSSTKAGSLSPQKELNSLQQQQCKFSDEKQQKVYKWAKGRLGYTQFHRDCCQLIYQKLHDIPDKIRTFKLISIKQLVFFVYYLQDYIFDEQIYKFSLQTYENLKSIIFKPSKQQIKESTKDLFEDISEKLLKLLHYYSDKEVKRQITLLGAQFALNLINNYAKQNIQFKLHGIRMLDKFANLFYYRGNQFVKDQGFALWLVKNNLWNMLISKQAEITMVQSSEYILKLIVNKGKIGQQKFQNFVGLLWQVRQDIRAHYFKSIDALRLTYSCMSLIIQNFKIVNQSPQLYTEQCFSLIQSIARYGSATQTKASVEVLLNVLKKHYFSWKQFNIKRKALEAMKYCFEKYIDGEKQFSQKSLLYVNILSQFIKEPNYLTLSISRKIFQSQQKKHSYALQKAAKHLVEQKKIIETIIKLMEQKVQYKQQLMYFLKSILTKYKSYNMSATIKISQQILLQALVYPQVFNQLINLSPIDTSQNLLAQLLEIICCQKQVIPCEKQIINSEKQTTCSEKQKQNSKQFKQGRQINFLCIRQLFYKVNSINIDVIEGEYFRPRQYLVKCDPNQLKFIRQLHQVMEKCHITKTLEQCAQLISDLYTCYFEGYIGIGKIKARQFMKNLIEKVQSISTVINDQSLSKNPQLIPKSYGILCLIKQMLSATQIHGVGNLKAHNSLITTSTFKVKIWNNAMYGDDVQRCYEKTVPSNLTLFELLSKIGEKFKVGQHQLYIQQGNNQAVPLKMNGHTLLELGFGNFKEFCAYKNPKVQLKKQPLKIDGQLNPRFVEILKEIFKMFSKQEKMGPKQIVNYIQGVTKAPSHLNDNRISALLDQYDSDHDGFLNEQDLIKFYFDSCDSDDKEENVWGNLINLHYRKDLRKFNEPIGPVQPENLFRFYMKNSLKSYQLLFNLCKSSYSQISHLAKSILVHLPTWEHFMSNSVESLEFQNKSTFEISYIMINVRYFLQKELKKQNKIDRLNESTKKIEKITQGQQNQKMQIQETDKIIQNYTKYKQQQESAVSKIDQEQSVSNLTKQEQNYVQKFLKNKNDTKIFNLVKYIYAKKDRTEEEQVLRVVSINILRTMINLPALNQKSFINQYQNIEEIKGVINKMNVLNLDGNYGSGFFIQLVIQCIQSNQFTVFQSALALSLLETNLKWNWWIQKAIFHKQYAVRKVILNFLVLYSIRTCFSINFFDLNVTINPKCCQQWYVLLFFSIKFNSSSQIKSILERILISLSCAEQKISETNYFDPILNGNLNLLKIIFQLYPQLIEQQKSQIYKLLSQKLLKKTLSNDNRLIEYELMMQLNPQKLLDEMLTLISTTKPTQKYQMKQNFVGIKNLGSTCYMNSILQQFFIINAFKDLVLSYPLKQIPKKIKVNEIEIVDDFLYQLQKLYTYLDLSMKKYYYPKQFCLTLKDFDQKPINTSIQEDAHEFLNKLFFIMQEYMKKSNKLSDLQKIFQGKTICQISCKQCQSKKQKIQDFYHLALEVKDFNMLKQSFNKFIAPEVIEDYFCEKCEKKSGSITKQTFLNQVPDILIINLQRIVFDLTLFQKVKVHSRLEFPEVLQLNEFMHAQSSSKNKSYRLKGVVIHSGTSQGGHYYSLIKINGEWYKFNDQTVTKFNFGDLERQAYGGAPSTDSWGDTSYSTNAYILFYEVQKSNQTNQSSNDTIFVSQNGGKHYLSQEINQKLDLQDPENNQCLNSPQNSPKKPQKTFLSNFKWEVIQQNKSFYNQLQIHQASFFQFTNKFYQSIRPNQVFNQNNNNGASLAIYQQWATLPNLKFYEKLFDIYLQIIKFYITFNNLPQKIFYQTGLSIYELITLLPEKTYEFFNKQIDIQKWAEVMCSHNQISLRELYKVALNKMIFVYSNYYGLELELDVQNSNQAQQKQQKEKQSIQNQQQLINANKMVQDVSATYKVQKLLAYFLQIASSELISKNIFKSFYFFEFWRINIDMDERIYEFCFKNNYLLTLLDLLMGNDSPFAPKDKKRQDFPYEVAVPLMQTVLKLINRKKNRVLQTPFRVNDPNIIVNYYELTEKQSQILSLPSFYKKMMKFKYDNGSLAALIYFMCMKDRQFSQKIVELFLIGLNRLDQVQDAFSLLNNIKTYLFVKDEYQSDRIKWMLGIPQFEQSGKMSYGLRYSNQSTNISYVSSRYFISDQKYKPALQVLHQKRCYYTDFQVRGVITLLEILANSQDALKYLLTLPPPTYLYQSYLTWIQDYIFKLQHQEHWGFSMDKGILVAGMKNWFEQVWNRKQSLEQNNKIPVLQYIIGKNKNVQLQQQIKNEVFSISKWVHETYVLENLPMQKKKQNLSLPDDEFNGKSLKNKCKYMVENCDVKDCSQELQSKKTIITLELETKLPLKIKFNLPSFENVIYVRKGEIKINYPYVDFPLQQYLEIEIIEEKSSNQSIQQGVKEQLKQQNEKMQVQNPAGGMLPQNLGYQSAWKQVPKADFSFESSCPTCTYINYGRQRCQMCDTYLY